MKKIAPLQDADHQQIAAGVVLGDELGDLGDPRLKGVLGDQHLPDRGPAVAGHSSRTTAPVPSRPRDRPRPGGRPPRPPGRPAATTGTRWRRARAPRHPRGAGPRPGGLRRAAPAGRRPGATGRGLALEPHRHPLGRGASGRPAAARTTTSPDAATPGTARDAGARRRGRPEGHEAAPSRPHPSPPGRFLRRPSAAVSSARATASRRGRRPRDRPPRSAAARAGAASPGARAARATGSRPRPALTRPQAPSTRGSSSSASSRRISDAAAMCALGARVDAATREEPGAHPRTRLGRVGVGRIFHHRQTPPSHQRRVSEAGAQSRAGRGLPAARGHSERPVAPGAAREAEEDRLRLVGRRVPGGDAG